MAFVIDSEKVVFLEFNLEPIDLYRNIKSFEIFEHMIF